jgi:hypothetical protein
MLQNKHPRRNIRSFLISGDVSKRLEKAKRDGDSMNWSTVRLSSGISANILDFRIPQKHVVGDMPTGAGPETG